MSVSVWDDCAGKGLPVLCTCMQILYKDNRDGDDSMVQVTYLIGVLIKKGACDVRAQNLSGS